MDMTRSCVAVEMFSGTGSPLRIENFAAQLSYHEESLLVRDERLCSWAVDTQPCLQMREAVKD
jgi:hypothetical protein